MKPAIEHEKDALDGGEVERPTRPAVRFGLVPDLAGSDQPGMVVDSVIDGGPAKAAGMRAGDRIVRIAEHEITDIYAYMSVLRDSRPGDQLAVVVVRDGQEHTLQVHLQGEPQPPAEH